jgi:hypothetical protein
VAQKTDNLKGVNNMGSQKPIALDPRVRGCSIGISGLQAADMIVDDARAGACRIGGTSW